MTIGLGGAEEALTGLESGFDAARRALEAHVGADTAREAEEA